MNSKRNRFLMAAVAGLALGAATPAAKADHKEVKCYGVNSCGQHAKCAVKADDIAAVKKLLGDKEFKAKFGKSATHECGAHASCGAASKILNWKPTSIEACTADGGIVIEAENGKKIARKAS